MTQTPEANAHPLRYHDFHKLAIYLWTLFNSLLKIRQWSSTYFGHLYLSFCPELVCYLSEKVSSIPFSYLLHIFEPTVPFFK